MLHSRAGGVSHAAAPPAMPLALRVLHSCGPELIKACCVWDADVDGGCMASSNPSLLRWPNGVPQKRRCATRPRTPFDAAATAVFVARWYQPRQSINFPELMLKAPPHYLQRQYRDLPPPPPPFPPPVPLYSLGWPPCAPAALLQSNPLVYFDIALGRYGDATPLGRIVMEVKADVTPKARDLMGAMWCVCVCTLWGACGGGTWGMCGPHRHGGQGRRHPQGRAQGGGRVGAPGRGRWGQGAKWGQCGRVPHGRVGLVTAKVGLFFFIVCGLPQMYCRTADHRIAAPPCTAPPADRAELQGPCQGAPPCCT